MQNDFTLSYDKRLFQLHKEQKTIICPKNNIVIHEAFDGNISLFIREIRLNFTEIQSRPVKSKEEKVYIYKPRKVSEASRRWNSSSVSSAYGPVYQNGGYL